jgi:hypothetical protein
MNYQWTRKLKLLHANAIFEQQKICFLDSKKMKIDICGEGTVFGHYQMSIGFEPDGGCDGQEKKTGT